MPAEAADLVSTSTAPIGMIPARAGEIIKRRQPKTQTREDPRVCRGHEKADPRVYGKDVGPGQIPANAWNRQCKHRVLLGAGRSSRVRGNYLKTR